MASFGAFIQLADEIDGLVHISQISNDRVEKVKEVLKIGQEVSARVIKVDKTERRIGLSIKAADYTPEQIEREKENYEALKPGEELSSMEAAFDRAEEDYRPGESKKTEIVLVAVAGSVRRFASEKRGAEKSVPRFFFCCPGARSVQEVAVGAQILGDLWSSATRTTSCPGHPSCPGVQLITTPISFCVAGKPIRVKVKPFRAPRLLVASCGPGAHHPARLLVSSSAPGNCSLLAFSAAACARSI